MTEFLSLEDLLTLADDLGVGPVRDVGLLAAAAHRPATRLWGGEAYPGLEDKAAALLESMVRNHSLVDGSKRLGWLATPWCQGVEATRRRSKASRGVR